ncbi:MAG: DNA repair protein RadA [Cytophagaceae bacterium]|nr:DNA repair protein RadA [Cytophagaceae bacterium]MDW8457352.1 DNA repair protein RadA [Cytophagaceae bacterium]
MSKIKTSYFCQSCGAQSPKWIGRCPACGQWNTYVEEVLQREDKKKYSGTSQKISPKPTPIHEISYTQENRIQTCDGELNRVLGGGIVPGSVILIGGEPGIGKSTLLLQLALNLVSHKVLYVSGEESEQQVKMRAERIGIKSDNCYILTETSTQNIFKQIEILEPDLLIVDSIQTLHSSFIESAAGSISQVRECTAELLRYAKESATPVFLIGHITKEGMIAGPKVLEHMVDTVLQFEGDRHLAYRILRATKNRFGSASELGIYEMQSNGLREVSNPSEVLISQRDDDLSGIAISATLEGNRPLLVEIQSLVSIATYGTPQRSCTGFDTKRLNMLLAVLEKRAGFRMGTQDVFLNITGGLYVEDPAVDLAVCASIASSFEDKCISGNWCFAAEVGLGGEVRAVNRVEQRITEAEKMGFKKIFISRYNKKELFPERFNIEVRMISRLDELFAELFS